MFKLYVFFCNQLLQGKTIPKLGSLDEIETGSGDAEGHYSGDCDDEDGCGGSGGGEVTRKISRVSKCKSHFLVNDLLAFYPYANIVTQLTSCIFNLSQ